MTQAHAPGRRSGRFVPSPAMVVALLALFAALAGSAYALGRGEVKSAHIETRAVTSRTVDNGAIAQRAITNAAVRRRHIEDGSVTGSKLAGLTLGDVGVTTTNVSVGLPALSAGQCAFVEQGVSGLSQSERVIALTRSGWDNRLMITGAEATGFGGGELALEVCNWTTGTNLGPGTGEISLLRL